MLEYAPTQLRPTIRFRPFVYLASRFGFVLLSFVLVFGLGIFWAMGNRLVTLPAAVLAVLLLLLLSAHLRKMRQLRAQLILQYIASAIQLRLPLPPYLRSAARSESLGVRMRLHRCAHLIAEGASIGTAFHLATGEIDLRVAGMLDVAQRTGQLDSTIEHLLRPARQQSDAPEAGAGVSLAYLSIITMVMIAILNVVLVFVFPKFAQLLDDFQLPMPWAMEVMLNLPQELMLMVSGVLVILAITVAGSATRQLFTSRLSPSWRTGLADRLGWYLPPMRRLTRDRAYADTTWLLAGAVESGNTLDEAISACIGAGNNRVLTRKLVDFRNLLLGGADAASAARDVNMPYLLVSLFRHESAPDLARALRFASFTYSARYDRLMVTLSAMLPVLISLFFGLCVAVMALGMFSPLAALIDSLSERIFEV